MNWQKETFSQKQLTSESFDNDNKLTLNSLFAFCSVFSQGQTKERWKRLLDRHSVRFQNTPEFWPNKFFHMANLFLLPRKVFVMCYCFRAPINTFFFGTCQMTVKSCVLHLFPVPQTGRSHIINILLASFFSVRTVNYGSSFFSIHLWSARFALGP